MNDAAKGPVLVTGGTGFVGRAVVEALAQGGADVHVADLRALDPGDLDLGRGAVTFHRADLLAGEGVGLVAQVKPHTLVHVAWMATPGVYWTAPDNLAWVAATLDLARAFADHGGRRVVGVGSCAEYDWSQPGTFGEETTPLTPATLYGAAKDGTRRVLEAFARTAGLSLAWARLFFLYGPHEAPRRLVSEVCAALLAGSPTRCTSGTQVRDFLHVGDAGRALATVATSGFEGAVNIGSGRSTTLREVVLALAAAAGAPHLAKFGDLPDNPKEPPVLLPDVARLSALGFRPRHTLEAGLAQTLGWWRQRR